MGTASRFVVVDVETTGFAASRHDRVVEVAILELDSSFHELRAWETLLNPERDVGATRVHGITAADVRNAPRFKDIAGHVFDFLSEAVFVGHNAVFDTSFVSAELGRCGTHFPANGVLCTLRLARRCVAEAPSFQLNHLCSHLQVAHPNNHNALDDARATAQVLREIERRVGRDLVLECVSEPACESPQKPVAQLARGATLLPRVAARHLAIGSQLGLLGRLLERIPHLGRTDPPLDEYIDLLDAAMLDRRVSDHELDGLSDLARRLGLGHSAILLGHRQYLTALIERAYEDGSLSKFEKDDIEHVGRTLGIGAEEVEAMISKAARTTIQSSISVVPTQSLRGKSVCFTGQLSAIHHGEPVTRSVAERLAFDTGLEVKARVTKGLDFLVTADPDSLSTKARQARSLGTMILSEQAFWQLLGISVD